jgi:hypothetical protein
MNGQGGDERQGVLFPGLGPEADRDDAAFVEAPRSKAAPHGRWRMPESHGRTVAQIRLRWPKRLSRAQVARVEQELAGVAQALTKLGFGRVVVDHLFVRRRKE